MKTTEEPLDRKRRKVMLQIPGTKKKVWNFSSSRTRDKTRANEDSKKESLVNPPY
jgi:hypothetical protein